MSLDIYLKKTTPIKRECFNCGSTYEEYETLYETNITHNLGKMADAAGIYEALWRPYRLKEGYDIPEDDYRAEWKFEEETICLAKDIISILEKGLADLKARPEYFEQFNASNGWGVYENFVPFVEEYLEACIENPETRIITSR